MKRKRYERFHEPLADQLVYRRRVMIEVLFGLTMMHLVMLAGMAGYHWICGLEWIDAFHNSCMILGGMGQIDALTTPLAKLFAGSYAFYAGPLFILCYGVMFAPIVHRWLHHHHLCDD